MADTKRTRVQFDFSEDALHRLEALQQETGAKTKAEVVRSALKVYEWLYKEFANTQEITIRSGDREITIPIRLLLG